MMLRYKQLAVVAVICYIFFDYRLINGNLNIGGSGHRGSWIFAGFRSSSFRASVRLKFNVIGPCASGT